MKDNLFGKYCYIDTPWIAGKKTIYRILASGIESNTYCHVPVNAKTKPEGHRDFEPIVYVVLDTLVSDRSEILRFALKDVEIIDDESKEVKHGEWQGTVCSMCGASVSNYYDCDFCPKCGANMQDNPHWINHTEYGVTTYVTDKDVECSECGHRQPKLFDMKYCPNCGADMRGETE